MSRPNDKEKPQRSCLGCRETRDKDQLLRFVLSPQDEVLPDLDARLPGRGAYTCINSRCLENALRQRLFNRAFKREVSTLPPDRIVAMIASLMRERILGYLGLANKSGKIISGGALVSDQAGPDSGCRGCFRKYRSENSCVGGCSPDPM